MVWGIGLLLIVAGILMIVYAMQGEPVIAPIHAPARGLEPVGEGTSAGKPVEVYKRAT